MNPNVSICGIYGASGFGQEVAYWLFNSNLKFDKFYYIDDDKIGQKLDGVDVIAYSDFLSIGALEKSIFVAIANSKVRESIFKKMELDQIKHMDVIGNYTFVRGASLSEGAFLSAFVDVTANVVVGKGFHCNTYSYVGHDCVIGDFVTFAPRVSCNGNVHIGDHAYIGTGAILRQGSPDKPLIIGSGAIVGMGAVVTKDVAAGATVVGNPAKVLVR